MKAITYRTYGGPEVLEYGDVPNPGHTRGKIIITVA